MKTIFVRSDGNYDMNQVSLDTGLKCRDASLAQQSFKEECDINTIVERFHLTGEVPQLQQLPAYQDYEGIFDFQSAMNAVREANETFMAMPAQLRARFHNEPQEFLEFCAKEENRDEARKLGLLATPLPVPPVETPQEPPVEPQGTKKGGKTPPKDTPPST